MAYSLPFYIPTKMWLFNIFSWNYKLSAMQTAFLLFSQIKANLKFYRKQLLSCCYHGKCLRLPLLNLQLLTIINDHLFASHFISSFVTLFDTFFVRIRTQEWLLRGRLNLITPKELGCNVSLNCVFSSRTSTLPAWPRHRSFDSKHYNCQLHGSNTNFPTTNDSDESAVFF